MADEKMNGKHMGHGQNCFDAVYPHNRVKYPAGHVATGENRIVENQASAAEDADAAIPFDTPQLAAGNFI